jgi:hypothetical protein
LLAIAVLISWQLFVRPALSVADNGDFPKIAGRYCIGPDPRIGDTYFAFTNLRWAISKEACWQSHYRSSAELVVLVALGLDHLAGYAPAFDLRWMGAAYALLFLCFVAWAQRLLRSVRPATARTLQVAFVLAVCNAVYIPLFNTFYMDTMALVTLVGALAGVAALLLQEQVDRKTFWITCIALGLLAGSKGQHGLLAVLCLPALWIRRGREVFPPLWARGAALALIPILAVIAFQAVVPENEGQVTYNVLLYRILPTVSNPRDYLREVHLPESYVRASGTYTYQLESPNHTAESAIAFGHIFGYADLVKFYLRHPGQAWFMLMLNLDSASGDRVLNKMSGNETHAGNFEKASGKPAFTRSRFFMLWPAVKHRLTAGKPRVFLAYIVGLITLAWWLAPRRPGMRALLAIFVAMLAFSLGTSMMDGLDAGRHLQIFNFLLDLLACGTAAFAAERFSLRSWRSRRPAIAGQPV